MTSFSRRTLLTGGMTTLTLGAASQAWPARSAPALVSRSRPTLPYGVMSGDVSTTSGVVWARSDRPGRLIAQLGRGSGRRVVRGPWATPETDLTAKLDLRGLRPGVEQEVRLSFESADGVQGEQQTVSFRTAQAGSRGDAGTSFVWTGDTCGQGWGINEDIGGMVGYRAMLDTDPDFFIHSGDTIYADGPLSETVTEPDGQVWKNLLIPEVTKVAETLGEFRGRHRYNHLDENLRAMYAQVPVVAQWDDHETTNNWYPGEILTDERYTEKRVDVLAARARQAWGEWQPIAPDAGRGRREGDRNRIYRKVARGPLLDVFCLDMRTYKGPNTTNLEERDVPVLGAEQLRWLVHQLRSSTATWKVIASDLPLGLIVPDGTNQEGISNGDPGGPLGREREIAQLLSEIKRHRVKNVLWVTADVHYCAAHHYDPSRASFTDFESFWELVAGPISAGGFGPSDLDETFGPEVAFRKYGRTNQSPRAGDAHFFGHVDIAADGLLTASLRDINGSTVWEQDIAPV